MSDRDQDVVMGDGLAEMARNGHSLDLTETIINLAVFTLWELMSANITRDRIGNNYESECTNQIGWLVILGCCLLISV